MLSSIYSSSHQSVRWLRRVVDLLTSFGKANMPLWLPMTSAIFVLPERILCEEELDDYLGIYPKESKMMQVDDDLF